MKQDSRGGGSSTHGAAAGHVGRTTRIIGRIHGQGDLTIEGRCEGEVTIDGHLRIAEGGVVTAPVQAHDLTVEGQVEGDVTARGAVIVRATGAIRGAIRAEQVSVDEGARFAGRIEMDVELPAELASPAPR
jgi:cytoskeletal protein CcmA (bactofilin family)